MHTMMGDHARRRRPSSSRSSLSTSSTTTWTRTATPRRNATTTMTKKKTTTTTTTASQRHATSSRMTWTTMVVLLLGVIWSCLTTLPMVVEAIPLLNGRYETVTDVQEYLDLALDAADMKESDVLATKLSIYQEGSDRGTTSSVNTVTLQSLSTTAETVMTENPYYHIFRHAFLVLGNANEGETSGMFDGAPIEVYGDTIVNDLFDLGVADIESEAALVMNVWMACVNYVWDVVSQCRAQNKQNAMAALDKVAALWIGEGQVEGSNDQGHLLYNLAENAGERFDQDDGEAQVNTKVIGLLVEIQTMLLGDQCGNVQGYEIMRQNVKRLIGVMTVPLVQNLIHHTMSVGVTTGGKDFVELYALGIIPRVAACDPEAYDTELHLDVLRSLTVAQQQDSITAIQRAYSCLEITCVDVGSYLGGAVPECVDSNAITKAGYTANQAGSRSKSYIDRDILQIDIFLKFQAYGVALDWYTHGWNSLYSLRQLSKNEILPQAQSSSQPSYYSIFAEYYQDEAFAHSMIENVLELIPPYNSASSEQVRNSVTGLLKYVVMWVASADNLKYAVEECQNGNRDTSMEYVDAGAMFFVGSMEGSAADGNSFGGELLFTTAKELCADFGTCLSEGDVTSAAINEEIMTAIKAVASNLDLQDCEQAANLVENTILPAMMVPLIQGTLKYASYNEDLPVATTDASLSIGDTFARAVLPLVNQASSPSAQTLRTQMQYQLNTQPVAGGFSTVADALRQAVPNMGVDCSLVGVLVDEPTMSNLCGDGSGPANVPTDSVPNQPSTVAEPTSPPVAAPAPSTPAGLAFGRYVFSDVNVADSDGSFSLDVKDMFIAASIDAASTVYTSGSNVLTGLSGEASINSLAAMSRQASQFMADDPMFNIYKYALYDDGDLGTLSNDQFLYADDVVVEALSSGNDKKLAAEGSVILNVWMLIVHRLYAAVRSCEDSQSPVTLIDSAVALWIGKEQAEGKYDNGWMLYSIGQSSAKFYGFAEGEAPVNSKLMTLFVEAQSVSKSCAQTPNASTVLRSMVHEIIHALTNPLLKSLLFHMVKNSKNMVELYAVAVVPQCAACNARANTALQTALFSGYSKEMDLTEGLIDHLATFLRCQRMTCEDIRTDVDADASLKELVDDLCQRLDYDSENPMPMAGYTPQTKVIETTRLDLDSLEMYIMMRTQAYKAAMDIYEHGHNSVGSSAFFGTEVGETDLLTLKELATTFERETVSYYQDYKNYFGSDNYADEIMTQAIRRTGDYASATREAASVLVRRTAQTMISYMGVLLKMQSAVDKCKLGSVDGAKGDWDRAVALYVGMVEGVLAGSNGQGEWMFSLGNELCNDFGVCETSGEAKVNQQLLFEFAGGRDSLIDGECDHIERTMNSEIAPRMAIPLIQGTVSFSADTNGGGGIESLASLHIVSQAVAPLVQKVSSSSASVLRQAYGSFQSISTSTTTSSIVSAFTDTISSTGINCDELGSPSGYTLCSGGPTGTDVISDIPTNLGDDLYVTTTYVQDRADIAKDITGMTEALMEGNYELAKLVYRDGKNAQEFDKDGKFVSLRTLKAFSTDSTLEMLDEPEFNIYMYALKNNRVYADDLVEEALQNVNSANTNIAAEAAMILNLWMEIVHHLHETLQACKVKELRDENGVHLMDVAVAYWIGDGQIAGDAENGHLLYALAEKFGELFNMDDGGQSRTNSNILRLFNEAKNEVSLPNACSDSRTTYTRLRRIVNRLIPQMSIPLVQGLIHYLRANDRERVKIYATAFVPLVAGCSPSLFATLQAKLLGMNYNVVEAEDLIELLRQSFPCLGLQCDDIGVHVSEATDVSPECNDPDVYEPLAGYRPASDVREYARLDLDIREMDVLMQMKAYDAVADLYSYGKHVKGPNRGSLSLFQIATTSQRTIVPSYDAFVRYYTNDGYADQIIRSALDPSQTSLTEEQRRLVVVKASQVLIMYFGALQNAYEAVSDCSSSAQLRATGNTETWDRVAAKLIGHLEGTKTNGTVEGYMYYDLGQEHCLEFGTCENDITGVEVNDQLISLLYTGRGAVLDNSCQALRKAADEISSLLLIPIIQGALSSALGLSNGENERLRAVGYVYSRALIPLVRNRDAANKLEEYLGPTPPQNTRRTAAEVYGALATAYPDMGVDCSMVGVAEGNDPCSGVVYDTGVSDTVWIVVGVLGGLLVAGCGGYFCMRSRRKASTLPENNPKFITSENGELNHSMDLLEKAFSSTRVDDRSGTQRSMTPPSETEALNAFHDASPVDDEDFESVPALSRQLESAPDII